MAESCASLHVLQGWQGQLALHWPATAGPSQFSADRGNVQTPMCTGCSPYWQCLSSCAHSVPGSGTAHCGQHLVRDHTCGVGQQRQCKSRVQDLWPVIVEAYRLDSATTRLGSLTLSMLTDPSRPHQVFPLLKATAKETEWFLPGFDICVATL